MNNIGNNRNNVICVFPYFADSFFILIACVSKCKIRYHRVQEDYISRLDTLVG